MTAEATLTWLVTWLLTAGIVLPSLIKFRRKRHADRARKQESAQLGFDRPASQCPQIDVGRCIGCGSCVEVCPEGDVLGIVGGTATIVNGLKCVGHGVCAVVCPVGAIEIGLGDLSSRQDIPLMDAAHETSVPGLYIAGELGGLALVKNAVNQAREVIERIAQKSPPLRAVGRSDVLDVAIVGAGPAGLAAAAAAQERGLRSVLLEQEESLGGTILHYPRRKLVLVQAVDIPLWGKLKPAEYAKERILEIFEDLTRRFGLDVRFGERVTEVRREDRLFAVKSARGAWSARSVVLALGRRGQPRKLGVPGEELPKVMYRLMDAESYKGEHVLMVGGGDSAVEAALGLAGQAGNQVTLSYRKEKLMRIKHKNEERIEAAIRKGLVRPLFGSQVVEIGERSVRLRVGAESVELANNYVFVFAGGEPPFGFLRQIGVRFGGEQTPAASAASA